MLDFKSIKNKKIITITLNPAIDKRWIINDFDINEVNRIDSVVDTAGGKGLNESRVLKTLGLNPIACGILAGTNGKYFLKLLRKEKIKHKFMFVKHGQTRICANIAGLKQKSQCELLEPGPNLDEKDITRFTKFFKKIIKNASIVSIAGGLPKGINSDYYLKLISICKEKNIKVFLDTSGKNLANSLQGLPNFIKPNTDEIAQLLNKTPSKIEAINFAKQWVDKGIENFVISLGGEGAILVNKNATIHALPPKHEVVNTVGCGDTMVAGFIASELLNISKEEQILFATNLSTAASLTKGTAEVHLEDLDKCTPIIQHEDF